MERTCTRCGSNFSITPSDLAFYDKVSPVFNGKKELIPPPTLCPECRSQRRAAWRNERSYYSRACDRCGKKIVTTYMPNASFPVYCHSCWWGEGWDPRTYGVELELGRSFFDQILALRSRMPHLTMMNDDGVGSENCEFTFDFAFGRNCYLVAGAWYLEDCYYCGGNCGHSKLLVDCYFIYDSELCYECLDSRTLYNCQYLQNCHNCSDCTFGFDLKGCRNCVGCSGLRQKEFHWFNEPCSEKEYRARFAGFAAGSYAAVTAMRERFAASILSLPRQAMQMHNCEECSGNYLDHCRHTHDSYMVSDCEFCRFVDKGEKLVWCYDILHTGNPQYCYENLTPDNSYMTHFSLWCWKDKNVLYSDNCHSSEHLCGCFGFKRGQYCILNKQYTKEEYNDLVPKIIAKMRADGEWGEFFPITMSPFAYNETVAQEYFPLTKEAVLQRGWKWRDQTDEMPKVDRIIPAVQLPDSINDIPDDILNWAIECEMTKRPFKIQKQELEYYRNMRIPIPRIHPDERHRIRFKRHNPQKLWQRNCMKCRKAIETSYAPERPEIVYCEECYLKKVY